MTVIWLQGSLRAPKSAIAWLPPVLQHWVLSPQQGLSLQNTGWTPLPRSSRSMAPLLTWALHGDMPSPPITAALSAGGEAPGAGEASFPQHSQEAHCMSPGSARGWGWQTFCKCLPTPAPPVASPLQDRGPTLGASFGVAVSSLQPFLCLWVGRCFCGVTAPSHLFPPFNLPEASPTMSRQDTVPLSLYSLHWGNKATLGSPPLGKLKPTFCHRFCVPPWSCKISWEKWHWFWRWQGTCEGFSL